MSLTLPCRPGVGRLRKDGYVLVGGRGAHRLAYEAAHGPIPPRQVIDHLCHNADPSCLGGNRCAHRACVEPTHLEAIDVATNVQRGKCDRRTHCIHGHEMTEENTYWKKDRPHSKACRTCIRNRVRRKRTPEQNAARRARYADDRILAIDAEIERERAARDGAA